MEKEKVKNMIDYAICSWCLEEFKRNPKFNIIGYRYKDSKWLYEKPSLELTSIIKSDNYSGSICPCHELKIKTIEKVEKEMK